MDKKRFWFKVREFNPVPQSEIERFQKSFQDLRVTYLLTQKQIAEVLGVSRATISLIENLKQPMSHLQYWALRGIFFGGYPVVEDDSENE